jgi:hypothetical protein
MDIKDPRLLKLKGVLFLLVAMMSGGLLIALAPDLRTFALLAVTIWASCRFYYFAFYVLHHYADPAYRYAGLWDLARYLITGKQRVKKSP